MINSSAATLIRSAGYVPQSEFGCDMVCASYPLETFAAPDWDSLAYYATRYQLCECGNHKEWEG